MGRARILFGVDMESRLFNIAIVLVWLTTTTWLVVAKVVPPLRRGQPPNYRSMYAERTEDNKQPPEVGWNMSLNGKPLGWAISRVILRSTLPTDASLDEVRSQIHFEHIPLAELSPPWMTKILMRSSLEPLENLQMDAFSTLKIDSAGHLAAFDSELSAAGLQNGIVISGEVQASVLRGKVRSADFSYPFEIYLPGDALVSDELSPQARLTGLRLGQEWTVPVFSPLRDPHSPVEILQAHVESRDLLMWEGQAMSVFQVIYRPDPGAALSSSDQPRAKLWVGEDGTVLKQEVSVLNSRLVFVRLSEEQSGLLAKQNPDVRPHGMYGKGWFGRGRYRYNHPEGPGSVPNDGKPNGPETTEKSSTDDSKTEPDPATSSETPTTTP